MPMTSRPWYVMLVVAWLARSVYVLSRPSSFSAPGMLLSILLKKDPVFYFQSPSKDVKSSLERLKETAYAVITRLQMLSNHMPLVKVLSTCLIMFYNRLHPRGKASKVMTITEKMLEELSIYHDFTFGMLYLHKEVSALFPTDPIFKEKDRSTPVENLSRTSSFDSQILPNTISIARQKLARMATSDTDDLF